MKKEELFEIGVNYIKQFCDVNNIAMPKIKLVDKLRYGCGVYYRKSKTINVCLGACAWEVNNPGNMKWSHRHYFTDREPCGVVCHEFGHYLHDVLTNYNMVLPKENKITSYEPDIYERFAETIKLFILNPDLLKNYDPKRYDKLIELGLKPIITTDWKTTFGENINPKFIQAAQNKINKVRQ